MSWNGGVRVLKKRVLWTLQYASMLNANIVSGSFHYYIYIIFFVRIQNELVHFTQQIRLNRVRLNNAVEAKKRPAKRQRNKIASSRQKNNLKLISKHIEWMTAWLSVRLQSKNWCNFCICKFSLLNTIIRVLTSICSSIKRKYCLIEIWCLKTTTFSLLLCLSKLSIYRIYEERSKF